MGHALNMTLQDILRMMQEQGCDITVESHCIERSIVNLVLAGDGKITLYLLGQPVVVAQGDRHV